MVAIIDYGEMAIAFILAMVLFATSTSKPIFTVALFVIGVLVLTVSEYTVHRFFLHNLTPIRHRLHHASPDEAVLTVFWQIWACFALVYLIAGGAVLAGVLVAYTWYLFVHHCAHHNHDYLPVGLLQHHQAHHRFAKRNYGVSTTLWDHVFRTMLR